MQEIPIVQGFTAGELTPWLSTRFDLQAYQRGALLIRNFQVQPYGGIQLRPGSWYIGPVADETVRLFPFCYSAQDILMLEFYSGHMRVYQDGVLLRDASGQVYTLETPWQSDTELASLHFSQVNDVVYVCCPGHMPVLLCRYGNADWECREAEFGQMPRETYSPQEGLLRVSMEEDSAYAQVELSGGTQRFCAEMAGREYLLADTTAPARHLFLNEIQKTKAVAAPDLRTGTVAVGTVCYQKDPNTAFFYFYHCIREYTPDCFTGSTDLADYPYYFQPGIMRLDATQQPYEVARDWEISTDGTWGAYWELWRSYDTPDKEPDFRLWSWTRIKSFHQSEYESRQNWSISGSEERPCRMVLVCRCCSASDVLGSFVRFRVHSGSREYKFRVVEVQDATHARVEVLSHYLGKPACFATHSWSFGAFGARNGYPAFSCMFQGRFWLGGMPGLPTTILASCTDDFHNFRVGSNADDAMHLRIMGSDQSRICWLCATRQLLIGTSDSEWVLSSGSGVSITPTTVAFRRQSSVGSETQPAQAMENTVLFIQRGGRRMREIAYRLESDGFSATDISMLAEHLFTSGVKEWCVQRGANFNVWVLMQDNSLAVLTINLEQQVTAWQRFATRGRRVLHLATLPSIHSKDDEVWLVVERESDASRHLERICSDAPHLDCCSLLEAGQNAPDLADAVIIDASTMEPTSYAAMQAGRTYYCGIPIEAELQTMPMEGPVSFNSVRQFSRFKLRLLESDTCFDYASTLHSNWEHIEARNQPELVAPYTGALRLPQMPDAGVGQSFRLRYTGHRDFRLLAITQEVDHHGK